MRTDSQQFGRSIEWEKMSECGKNFFFGHE